MANILERLVHHAPFGQWHTQTFIVVLGGVGPQVRTDSRGRQPVIPQVNLHPRPAAPKTTTSPFCHPKPPDLDPTETAFSQLKTSIRKAGARTYQSRWKQLDAVCVLS